MYILYTTINNLLCIFKGTVKEPLTCKDYVKEPLVCKDYVKVSLLSYKLTFNKLFTKSHPCILSLTKALVKEIFSGVVLNTSTTGACCLRIMLNRDENWDFSVWSHKHMPS